LSKTVLVKGRKWCETHFGWWDSGRWKFFSLTKWRWFGEMMPVKFGPALLIFQVDRNKMSRRSEVNFKDYAIRKSVIICLEAGMYRTRRCPRRICLTERPRITGHSKAWV
jgi:hypothetical protein